jgi:hypothetical protein
MVRLRTVCVKRIVPTYIRLPVVDTEAGLQVAKSREARVVALVALLLSLAGNQGEGKAYFVHDGSGKGCLDVSQRKIQQADVLKPYIAANLTDVAPARRSSRPSLWCREQLTRI